MNTLQQLKILRHRDVILSILLDDKIPIPVHVEIEPTELCNHRCIFCHWHGEPRKNSFPNCDFTGKARMPINRLTQLIDELQQIETKAISFTGTGDPLLYKGMEAVLSRLSASSIDFAITSTFNMNLSDSMISLLCNASWLRWSIDAGSENIYRKVHNPRGSIPLSNTLENIKRLTNRERKTKINASFVICETNKHEILQATILVKETGGDSISFRPDIIFERSEKSRKYEDEIIRQLEEAKTFETSGFKVFVNYERLSESNLPQEDIVCYYSNHSIFIAATGDVYPCCMTSFDKKYSLGNILKQSFKEFWNSKERKDNYKKINMRFCPPCHHAEDNEMLRLLYGDTEKADNFI